MKALQRISYTQVRGVSHTSRCNDSINLRAQRLVVAALVKREEPLKVPWAPGNLFMLQI